MVVYPCVHLFNLRVVASGFVISDGSFIDRGTAQGHCVPEAFGTAILAVDTFVGVPESVQAKINSPPAWAMRG